MKRIIGLAIVISFVFATLAQAQTPGPVVKKVSGVSFVKGQPAPTVKPKMLTKAAIERAVAATFRSSTVLVRRDRPIYKKAWPYVVGAIVAVAIIYWINRDDDSPIGVY